MQSPQGLEADRGALADVDDEDRMEDQMSQPTAVGDFNQVCIDRSKQSKHACSKFLSTCIVVIINPTIGKSTLKNSLGREVAAVGDTVTPGTLDSAGLDDARMILLGRKKIHSVIYCLLGLFLPLYTVALVMQKRILHNVPCLSVATQS